LPRREFLTQSAATVAALALLTATERATAAEEKRRAMKICLTPGSIGVNANQSEAIALAERHGFEAVEPYGGQLASLSPEQRLELVARLKANNLVWGAAGLTVEFRQDEEKFRDGIKELPRIAAALQDAGAQRVGTWLSPAHNTLTYLQNFRQHAQRLREASRILKDHGLRLGLEYVGTQTLRNGRKYPFVHTLEETRELIGEIGTGHVGFILDTWHWWTAGDTVEQIQSLKSSEVISVDLNDAPAGIPKDQQIDGRRELPVATGVIDVASFLKALQQIGYDGPVRPEPFNRALNELDNEAACAATIKAMRAAFERLG
jgi:sugar phosphate isomerase/epimerase